MRYSRPIPAILAFLSFSEYGKDEDKPIMIRSTQFANLSAVMTVPFAGVAAAHRSWKLAGSGYLQDNKTRRLQQKFRWAIAAAVTPRLSLDWFDMLDHPQLRIFAEINPRLAFKPMRVYMSVRWSKLRKIKVIMDTYQIIQEHKGALLDALIAHEECVLASFVLEGYGESKIVLGHDRKYRKEGELVATLRCGHLEKNVISMAFSLERSSDGSCACYIGCIQGGHQDDAKQTAKAMHGLRPKALMVFVAQEIASVLGAVNIYGVGNAIQAHRKKHLIRIPFRHDITFDYDGLWIESGGVPTADQWFSLPLESQRRSVESIKANKRSMYLRRYNFMNELSGQIRANLAPEIS
jgi:uncharacterized protein